jgi:hypothetical protein
MKFLSRNEILFLSGISVCLGSSAAMLYRDMTGPGKTGSGVQVGTITYKNKFAEQKPGGSTLWTALEQNGPVYNKDTIRTGPGSTAIIRLGDSAEMTLDEESMVFIDMKDKSPRLRLSSGILSLASQDQRREVLLETPSGNVSVKGGTLKVQESGDGYSLRLLGGEAEIRERPDAAATTMEKNGNYNIASRVSEESGPVPLEPADGELIITDGKAASVSFKWDTPVPKEAAAAPDVRLLVAGDRAFAKPEFDLSRPETGTSLVLAEGTHYWKLSDSGEIRRFTVIKGMSPKPLSPVGRNILHAGAPVAVSFSWTTVREAGLYRLEIYDSRNPAKPLAARNTTQTNITVDISGTGDYTWKAVALIGAGGREFPSDEADFSLIKGNLETPDAGGGGPSGGIRMSSFALEEGAPLASWKSVSNAKAYEVILSSDPGGKSVLLKKTTGINSLKLDDPLDAGDYYLTVRAVSEAGSSDVSAPVKIGIFAPRPLIPLEPAQDQKTAVEGKPLRFVWKDENGGSRYRLSVASDPAFISPLAEITAKKTSAEAALPPETSGILYWKASLLDKAGKIIAETPVSSFSLTGTIEAPVPVSPVRGVRLDLNTLDTLNFAWKPSRKSPASGDRILYRVRLYRMTGGIKTLISDRQTDGDTLRLTDLSNLALDNFAWELTAETRTASGDLLTSPPASSYFSIVQSKPLSVPKIKKMSSKGEY